MGQSVDLQLLRDRVRAALNMVQVCTMDQLQLRIDQGGRRGHGRCPFHEERSGSFVAGGRFKDRCHCFGCGVDYDIFEYWQVRHNMSHSDAVMYLARHVEILYDKPLSPPVRSPEKRLGDDDATPEKPSLPPLKKAKEADLVMIAETRKLSVRAIAYAASMKQLAVVPEWPLFEDRSGEWWRRDGWEPARCWAATDPSFNVAEFRRLDNKLFESADGVKKMKTWSTKGKSWPLGAVQIGDRQRVLMVEGGPDLLAGYHFLECFHTRRRPLLLDVAVVCMLGAGNRIRSDALIHFKNKRVRIMVDSDTPKDSDVKGKRKLVGLEAAARWTDQLTEAGAAVECFYVGDIYDPDDVAKWHAGDIQASDMRVIELGFKLPDGGKIKDVNDLATAGGDVLESEDLEQAFTDWDF